MLPFPQNAEKMVPATGRFYEAVLNRQLSHNGDPRLARHVGNVVLRIDQRGGRIYKESRASGRKIDSAVAAVTPHIVAWRAAREEIDFAVRCGVLKNRAPPPAN